MQSHDAEFAGSFGGWISKPKGDAATVSPDDIPTEITALIYSAPFKNRLSQNDVAAILAHFYPAIEQHVRATVAEELQAVDPVEWALAGQHAGTDAARIARKAVQ
jgi:asparagine N-glycosylation enzyme membrane subunit Stt3